jgi:hypothetical protein
MQILTTVLLVLVFIAEPSPAAPQHVVLAKTPILDEFPSSPPRPRPDGECLDTATILWEGAFSVHVEHGRFHGDLLVPLEDFIYDQAACQWEYELEHPTEIVHQRGMPGQESPGVPGSTESAPPIPGPIPDPVGIPPKDLTLATVNSLILRFQLAEPYEIYYAYDIDIADLPAPIATVKVELSPVEIPVGEYQGRTYEAEGFWETSCDDWVQKNAIGMEAQDPPGYESIVDHMVLTTSGTAETFQRGFAWMSCDSCECGGSVDFGYPMPPDYFWIPFGEVDRFWVEHSWQGSAGDSFSSVGQFTLEQQ